MCIAVIQVDLFFDLVVARLLLAFFSILKIDLVPLEHLGHILGPIRRPGNDVAGDSVELPPAAPDARGTEDVKPVFQVPSAFPLHLRDAHVLLPTAADGPAAPVHGCRKLQVPPASQAQTFFLQGRMGPGG